MIPGKTPEKAFFLIPIPHTFFSDLSILEFDPDEFQASNLFRKSISISSEPSIMGDDSTTWVFFRFFVRRHISSDRSRMSREFIGDGFIGDDLSMGNRCEELEDLLTRGFHRGES